VTPEDRKTLAKILLGLVPKDGTSIGNITLIQQFKDAAKKKLRYHLNDEDYWDVRNHLIEKGRLDKGRGMGGSVYRVHIEPIKRKKKKKKTKESDLYPPFQTYIQKIWVNENNIKNFVLEKTAAQGTKKTGGKWTRPDFALVTIKTYPFIPGKILDLITFEIKPENGYRIEGVFETASHSRFSNKSYLAIHLPDASVSRTEEFERVKRECERFGLGLITFTSPEDLESYETIQEAERKTPDPADLNGFIASQLSNQNQQQLLEMVK